MIRASFLGAPWLPTFKKNLLASLKLADIKEGQVVYDLGSGDGRWLFKAARFTKAKKLVGYEISLLPYGLSKIRWFFSPYKKRLDLKLANYFLADLSEADLIYCFGLPEVMKKLEPKLKQELKPGARLVSCAFKFPNLKPIVVIKEKPSSTPLYLYQF